MKFQKRCSNVCRSEMLPIWKLSGQRAKHCAHNDLLAVVRYRQQYRYYSPEALSRECTAQKHNAPIGVLSRVTLPDETEPLCRSFIYPFF